MNSVILCDRAIELHYVGARTILTKGDIMHLKKCVLRFDLNMFYITFRHSARCGHDPGAGVFAFLIYSL